MLNFLDSILKDRRVLMNEVLLMSKTLKHGTTMDELKGLTGQQLKILYKELSSMCGDLDLIRRCI